MRRGAIIAALLPLAGCSPHMRVGSPHVQRAPELICIVLIEEEPNKISAEVAQAAIHTCRTAIEETEKEPKEPTQ